MRRRLLLNLLPRPLLILQVQLDLALVHCPSINGNNLEGETNKQTSRGGMCRGTDARGGVELHSMWSPLCNASEYAEELRRCIRDASEKDGVQYTGSYSDNEQLHYHVNFCIYLIIHNIHTWYRSAWKIH